MRGMKTTVDKYINTVSECKKTSGIYVRVKTITARFGNECLEYIKIDASSTQKNSVCGRKL